MRVHTTAACVAALFLAASVFGHTVALRLLLLAAGIVLASITVAQSRGEVRALPPIWLPFALWAAWAALSLTWSLEPERSLKEWRNEVFYTGAGLWVCYVAAQARGAARVFLAVLGAAAALACLIALYDFSQSRERYAEGWHGGPGDHSSALLTLMPGTVALGWYARRARWRLWASSGIWVLAALLLASAYTTLNRTIWLGFALEFALIGFLVLLRAQAKAVASAVTVAVVAGCGAMVLNIQTERESMGTKSVERDHRLALWPEILERIEERPLTGYGFGRGIMRDSLQHQFKSLDAHLWHAHNLFLEALLQMGAPGLILLLLLLGAIVREGWRYARGPDEATAACGIALLGVVAGMLLRNMTDTLLVRQNALLFWGVVGVLLAIGTRPWRASS